MWYEFEMIDVKVLRMMNKRFGKIYMDISQHKNRPQLNLDFCRFESKPRKKFGGKNLLIYISLSKKLRKRVG